MPLVDAATDLILPALRDQLAAMKRVAMKNTAHKAEVRLHTFRRLCLTLLVLLNKDFRPTYFVETIFFPILFLLFSLTNQVLLVRMLARLHLANFRFITLNWVRTS